MLQEAGCRLLRSATCLTCWPAWALQPPMDNPVLAGWLACLAWCTIESTSPSGCAGLCCLLFLWSDPYLYAPLLLPQIKELEGKVAALVGGAGGSAAGGSDMASLERQNQELRDRVGGPPAILTD